VKSALKVKAFFVVRLRGKTFTKKAATRRSGTVPPCDQSPARRTRPSGRARLSHTLSPHHESRVSSLSGRLCAVED
jgi:hypothetical protein